MFLDRYNQNQPHKLEGDIIKFLLPKDVRFISVSFA